MDTATPPAPKPRLVSVVIGTRDRPETLRAALASIRALEGPDLKFEILVGDNGTTLETARIVAEYGGKHEGTSVYGCPAARNVAMRKVNGEFVAFLDDDDVWTLEHVRPHIALLDADPRLEAAFGQVISTDEDLRPIGTPWPNWVPSDGDFFVHMMSGYFPQVGATVARARVIKKYGLMDESLIGDSDWDWQLRIARDHRIGFVETPCVLFRQRKRGSFDNLQKMRAGFTRKIFLRYAWPNLRRWRSPLHMAQSFFQSQKGYYLYFSQAALERAQQGDRLGALRAIATAFGICPNYALRDLLWPSLIRSSVRMLLLPT